MIFGSWGFPLPALVITELTMFIGGLCVAVAWIDFALRRRDIEAQTKTPGSLLLITCSVTCSLISYLLIGAMRTADRNDRLVRDSILNWAWAPFLFLGFILVLASLFAGYRVLASLFAGYRGSTSPERTVKFGSVVLLIVNTLGFGLFFFR